MNNKKDDGVPLAAAGGNREVAGAGGGPHPAVAVGQRLAAARVEKGRSIDEMASRLKVSPLKVAALEAGDLAPLHDAAFAIGLTRGYAKVLGIDPDPLTDALRGVRRQSPDLAPPATASKGSSMRRANVPLSWSTRRSDRRSWIWGGSAAVIVLILLALWRVGSAPNGWLQRVKGEAATDVAAANPQGVSAAAAAALPPAGASGMSAAAPADAGSHSVAAALAEPLQALATPIDSGSSAAATLAAVSSASSPGVPAAAAGASAPSVAPAPGASRVSIVAKADTWISIEGADGRSAFSGTVRAGQTQNVDAPRPLRLVIGNMTGIGSIEQDGKAVDLARYAGNGKNVARFSLQ